jgi:hypothetical protein
LKSFKAERVLRPEIDGKFLSGFWVKVNAITTILRSFTMAWSFLPKRYSGSLRILQRLTPPSRHRLMLEVLEDRRVPSTLTVTNLSDHDPGSLRDTIAQAASGDTIVFDDPVRGTITLTTGELVLIKDLDIEGPGADMLTVSGNNSSRVFDVIPGVNDTIAGLTISNGKVFAQTNLVDAFVYGGGIYNSGNLALNNCTVAGNLAQVQIDNNTGRLINGDSFGGGLFNNGTATVTACGFSDNIATYGFSITGSSTVVAGGYGGAIDNSGTLTVSDTTFEHNTGVGYGGGLYNTGQATVSTSTFFNNQCPNGVSGNIAGLTSYSYGGGIANYQGNLFVINSTITGNIVINGVSAPNGLSVASGGGIYSLGELILINSTVAGNSVSANGTGGASGLGRAGGVYVDPYSPQPGFLANTLLTNNILTHESGTNATLLGPDAFGPFFSLGHNLISRTDDSSGWVASDLTGTIANPLDARLDNLADNGGPTRTMALFADSPAIDAGDNAYATDWDQRGDGFPRVVNGIIDIGAFEFQGGGDSPTGLPSNWVTVGQNLKDPATLFRIKTLETADGITEGVYPGAAAIDAVYSTGPVLLTGGDGERPVSRTVPSSQLLLGMEHDLNGFDWSEFVMDLR